MKQYALALMGSVAALLSSAQNLVPNPSFEEYLECPFSTAELENQVIDWFSWQESPDFFHVCSNDIDGFAGVPENALGAQLPISGNGYAAIVSFVDILPDGREYIAAALNNSLEIGENYYIMFHVSLFDGGSEVAIKCASNNLGLRFFKDPNYSFFPPDNAFQADNFAHLNYNEIIEDDEVWTKVDGWFTADDAYNWVALGNFYDDQNTLTLVLNDENACTAAYYIENICVSKDPAECEYLLNSHNVPNPTNQIYVYPNPASNQLNVQLTKGLIESASVYDSQGKQVASFLAISNSTLSIDVSKFQKGFYVLRVRTDNQIFNHKIILK